MRIGQGYDVHALVKGRKLIVGGVAIRSKKRARRALRRRTCWSTRCATRCWARALGDIAAFSGQRSEIQERRQPRIPARGRQKIREQDSRSAIWTPRSSPRRRRWPCTSRRWSRNLAADLEIRPDQVNVKAKTARTARRNRPARGIAAEAIALLE